MGLSVGSQGQKYGKEKSGRNNFVTENHPRQVQHTKLIKHISQVCSDVPSSLCQCSDNQYMVGCCFPPLVLFFMQYNHSILIFVLHVYAVTRTIGMSYYTHQRIHFQYYLCALNEECVNYYHPQKSTCFPECTIFILLDLEQSIPKSN